METAAYQFKVWLDTVSTDTSLWRKPNEDADTIHPYYSNEDKKERKTQGYIHRYMMNNHNWYREMIAKHKEIMESDYEGNFENTTKDYGQEGFWDQFK